MSFPRTGINYNRSDWKVPTQTWGGIDVIMQLHWTTCCRSITTGVSLSPFALACGSEPICGKGRTLKEPFFSRRSSFTSTPLPILSVAQFLPLFLAFKLSLWWPWREFFGGWWWWCWWEGRCCGNSSGPSLPPLSPLSLGREQVFLTSMGR